MTKATALILAATLCTPRLAFADDPAPAAAAPAATLSDGAPPAASPAAPQPAPGPPNAQPAPGPSNAQPAPGPPNAQPYPYPPPYGQPYPPYGQPYPPYGQPYPPYGQPYPLPPPAAPLLNLEPNEIPPEEPGPYEPSGGPHRNSPAMMGVGIALTALGGIALPSGVVAMWVMAYTGGSGSDGYAAPIALIAGGTLAIAVGIPMIIIGKRPRGASSSTHMPSMPAWAGSPHGGGWAWSF